MNVLLDTSTLLWAAANDAKLSSTARTTLLDLGNELYLSAVSVWEITLKHSIGKLPLPVKPEKFIKKLRDDLNLQRLAIDDEAVLQIYKLPPIHQDPFDRLLICQAIVHGLTILTSDDEIQKYPVMSLW